MFKTLRESLTWKYLGNHGQWMFYENKITAQRVIKLKLKGKRLDLEHPYTIEYSEWVLGRLDFATIRVKYQVGDPIHIK